MSLGRRLRGIWRAWPLIAAGVAVGLIAAYALYQTITPQYRSNVTLIVVAPTASSDPSAQAAARTAAAAKAQAIAEVAKSQPAIQGAVLAAYATPDRPTVTVTTDPGGPFIHIQVTDTTADRAQSIADQFVVTLPTSFAAIAGPQANLTLRNVAPATLATSRTSASLGSLLSIGALLGLLAGLVAAAIRTGNDHAVRDVAAIEAAAGVPVLATIPIDVPNKKVPMMTAARSPRAESYRHLRTAVLTLRPDLATILVTGAAAAKEGRSTIAINLAIAMSHSGNSVVLVEADLRHPSLATSLGVRPRAGLTDVLAGKVGLDVALTKVDEGRVDLISAGRVPVNPSEALGSDAMEHVLDELVRQYDYVVIDSPPVLPVSDAAVLAPRVDGVVLVASMGRTTEDQLTRATALLMLMRGNILGVVANRVGRGTDRDHRYAQAPAGERRSLTEMAESVADRTTRSARESARPEQPTRQARREREARGADVRRTLPPVEAAPPASFAPPPPVSPPDDDPYDHPYDQEAVAARLDADRADTVVFEAIDDDHLDRPNRPERLASFGPVVGGPYRPPVVHEDSEG
jgi:capsular exopolysaccharide synthesis family protein